MLRRRRAAGAGLGLPAVLYIAGQVRRRLRSEAKLRARRCVRLRPATRRGSRARPGSILRERCVLGSVTSTPRRWHRVPEAAQPSRRDSSLAPAAFRRSRPSIVQEALVGICASIQQQRGCLKVTAACSADQCTAIEVAYIRPAVEQQCDNDNVSIPRLERHVLPVVCVIGIRPVSQCVHSQLLAKARARAGQRR